MTDTTENHDRFPRRQQLSKKRRFNYKIYTVVSSTMLLFSVSYYTLNTAVPRQTPHHRSWPVQPATPFTQSSTLTAIYWLVVSVAQLFYAKSLWSSGPIHLATTASIGSHHVLSNFLLLGFVNLWVRDCTWIAELLLVINFFNLSFAYFRYPTAPYAAHIGIVAGPLAWNFAALYWFGAIAFPSAHFLGRFAANVSMWGWLGYGVFFLKAYRDCIIGFALSLLSFSTALGQFANEELRTQMQSVFATTVGGVLFALSLAVCVRRCLIDDKCPEEESLGNEEKLSLISAHTLAQ